MWSLANLGMQDLDFKITLIRKSAEQPLHFTSRACLQGHHTHSFQQKDWSIRADYIVATT
jgi:hypothetical protein